MAEWSDPCDSRGAALTHKHWQDCRPEAGHPGGPFDSDGQPPFHQYNQCCHCETVIDPAGDAQRALEAQELRDQSLLDGADEALAKAGTHLYQPTMVGLCLRCHLPASIHPQVVTYQRPVAEEHVPEATTMAHPDEPDPNECSLRTDGTHDGKLTAARGNEGGWSLCPMCGLPYEPKMVSGNGPQGRTDERGRGDLSFRQKMWLEGWFGWVAFNEERSDVHG